MHASICQPCNVPPIEAYIGKALAAAKDELEEVPATIERHVGGGFVMVRFETDDEGRPRAGLKKPEIKVRQISAGAPPNLRWSSARAPLVALEAPLISTDLRWPPAGHPYSRGHTHPSPCVRSRARAAAPYCAGVDRRRGALGAEA